MALFESIRKYGFGEVCCDLFGRTMLLKVDFEVLEACEEPRVSLFWLTVNLDIQLSTISEAPGLPACLHAP